jgi:hypothetical protein
MPAPLAIRGVKRRTGHSRLPQGGKQSHGQPARAPPKCWGGQEETVDVPASPRGGQAAACRGIFTFPTSREVMPAPLAVGGVKRRTSHSRLPQGGQQSRGQPARAPPQTLGGSRGDRGRAPPPPGGVKWRPAGASSPSPQLHHPRILFRQPGVTSTRTCSSGIKFSLMEAATRQHRNKTAGKPRRSKTTRHRVPMGVLGLSGAARHQAAAQQRLHPS